jgi:hypothetical protein
MRRSSEIDVEVRFIELTKQCLGKWENGDSEYDEDNDDKKQPFS